MAKTEYRTELFNLMQQYRVNTIPGLTKHEDLTALTGEVAEALDKISKFYGGYAKVKETATGEYIFDGAYGSDFNARTRKGKTEVAIHRRDGLTSVRKCTFEEYGRFQSLVLSDGCYMVWPKDFVAKEDKKNGK